jgi:hypothetical protein
MRDLLDISRRWKYQAWLGTRLLGSILSISRLEVNSAIALGSGTAKSADVGAICVVPMSEGTAAKEYAPSVTFHLPAGVSKSTGDEAATVTKESRGGVIVHVAI